MPTQGSASEQRRQLAVQRVKDGYTQREVAEFLGVHERTVRSWVALYRQEGEAALATKPRSGRPRKLSASKVNLVLGWLRKNPKSFGFPTELWTGKRIANVIDRKFNVKYHPRYVTAMIIARGFSCQKPQRRAANRDEAAVQQFLQHDWPRLQNRQDANGPPWCSQLMPLVRRTLAPRGKPPILYHSQKFRDKVSLMGALTISPQRGRLGFYCSTVPNQSYDDHAVAWFLRQLLRHQRGKVLLMWDRSPIHRGPEVNALLVAHPRLKIKELPAYAPELNPVEVIWSYLKFGKLSNLTAQDVGELEEILNHELKKLERNQKLLKKLSLGSELTGLDRLLLT
jgi:transposase